MNQDSRSRKWQITINNPHDKSITHETILDTIEEMNGILYYCLSDEIGESGTMVV